jgi:hypothetical protein
MNITTSPPGPATCASRRARWAGERTVSVRCVDRLPPGRRTLSPRAVNLICEQIGRWHEPSTPTQPATSPRFAPMTCDTDFAYRLSAQTNHDAYELQRRLGHQSQRYIQRYTNPPEHIAAGYIEHL